MIAIAEDVLRAAKDRIVANMHFMDSAIFALREKCDANREGAFATDGATLYYSPDYVVSMGRDGISEMMHAYMHLPPLQKSAGESAAVGYRGGHGGRGADSIL